MAVWMVTNHPKGIASTTLAMDLKITQKSAWFVLHRLRHAARTQSFNAPLKGTIEADTTYVSGKEKNKHAVDRKGGTQGGAGKSVVLGILERDGELRAAHVLSGKGLGSEVISQVSDDATIIIDEDKTFRSIGKTHNHHTVNYSAGEYVRHFHTHTNGIESVWALLKRQIIGIHHWVRWNT